MADTMQVFERWVTGWGLEYIKWDQFDHAVLYPNKTHKHPHRVLICLPPEDMPRMYPGMKVWVKDGGNEREVTSLPYVGSAPGTWLINARAGGRTFGFTCNELTTEPPRTTLSIPVTDAPRAREVLEAAGITVEGS